MFLFGVLGFSRFLTLGKPICLSAYGLILRPHFLIILNFVFFKKISFLIFNMVFIFFFIFFLSCLAVHIINDE